MRPALSELDGIVMDLVSGERDVPQTLARLRAKNYTADGIALLEAKFALDARDRFLYRDGDPYALLGIDRTPPGVDIWQLAVDRCEADYEIALTALLRSSRVRRVAS